MPVGAAAEQVALSNTVGSGAAAMGERARLEGNFPGGQYAGRTLGGEISAANTEVTGEMVDRFAQAGRSDPVGALATLSNASQLGLQDALGPSQNPDRAVYAYGFGHQHTIASTEKQQEHGVPGWRAGQAAGTEAAASTMATEITAAAVGLPGMVASGVYPRVSGAVDAQTRAGLLQSSVAEAARYAGQTGAARDVGQLWAMHKLAEVVFGSDSLVNVAQVGEGQARVYHGVLQGEDAHRAIDALVAQGLMPSEQADLARTRAETSGLAFALNYGPDGRIASTNVGGAVGVTLGSTVTDETGVRTGYHDVNSTQVTDSASFDQSLFRLQNNAVLASQLGMTFNLDGTPKDDAMLARFRNAAGGALEAQSGGNINSQTLEQFNRGWYAEGGVGLPAPLTALTAGMLSAKVGGRIAKDWAANNAINMNESGYAMQAVAAGAMKTARDEYVKVHGELPAQGTPGYREAERAIEQRAAEITAHDAIKLAETMREESEFAAQGNEAIESLSPQPQRPKPGEPGFGGRWRMSGMP